MPGVRAAPAGEDGAVADETGDPVCWLHRLCPECGAVPSEEDDGACWRCGNAADDHDEDG
jgi:ribosomal protein S27AE